MFQMLRRKERKYVRLIKRKNIDYELEEQCKKIESAGDRILNCVKTEDENLIIFRRKCAENELEDATVYLRMIVIRKEGVLATKLRLDAVYSRAESNIFIGDIKIQDDNINRGYGTLMIKELFRIALEQKVEEITGNISSVDWDHIERLIHFYNKNGFKVILDEEKKEGKIQWFSKEGMKNY